MVSNKNYGKIAAGRMALCRIKFDQGPLSVDVNPFSDKHNP
jgi:hypothetical protein